MASGFIDCIDHGDLDRQATFMHDLGHDRHMQTFLPHPDFRRSAEVLDQRRLGKQRVEAMQVLNALARTTGGWVNHSAVRMWRGYEDALSLYTLAMCDTWRELGHSDTVRDQMLARCLGGAAPDPADTEYPPWLGDEALHRSHQSNLIRKDPAFYAPLFPGIPADLPYIWPM
jgi:hypothetical protein